MEFLLRLKSWQLFLLVIIPCVSPDDTLVGRGINAVGFVVYIGWIYTIGCTMNLLVPPNVRPNLFYFKLSCLFIFAAYVAMFFIGGFTIDAGNVHDYGYWIWLLIPLTFYMLWSMLYIFAFAARMLESVIQGNAVGVSGSLKAFFCFWFFPIGLWYIQPAVQRIIDDKSLGTDN